MDKIKIVFDIIVASEFHPVLENRWRVTDDQNIVYLHPVFTFPNCGDGNMKYAEKLLDEWVKENYPDKEYLIYYWWWND
jgi:hypothetical protein